MPKQAHDCSWIAPKDLSNSTSFVQNNSLKIAALEENSRSKLGKINFLWECFLQQSANKLPKGLVIETSYSAAGSSGLGPYFIWFNGSEGFWTTVIRIIVLLKSLLLKVNSTVSLTRAVWVTPWKIKQGSVQATNLHWHFFSFLRLSLCR